MRVLKTTLDEGMNVITAPEDARIVHVGNQDENVTVWYATEEPVETKDFNFEVVQTGEVVGLSFPFDYVGTVLLAGGTYVLHIFTEIEEVV